MTIRGWLIVLFIVSGLLVLGARPMSLDRRASAQAQSSSITVHVTNPPSGTGVPIPGVTVTLVLNGTTTSTGTTDAQGNSVFSGIAVGTNYDITVSRAGYTFQPQNQGGTTNEFDRTVNFTGTQNTGSSVAFAAASFSIAEQTGAMPEVNRAAFIQVIRTGDLSATATVDFATSDSTANQRTDYITASGTLTFGPNEGQKTFPVLIIDNAYVDGTRSLNLTLSSPVGAALGSPSTAVLTIADNDTSAPTANPIDGATFFTRQHYYDFLSRIPDEAGLAFWANRISECGNDQNCIRGRRLDVSNAFFYELEFQQTGAYVYRVYRAAFGNDQPFPNPDPGNVTEAKKIPRYANFVADRARVIAGTNQAQSQLDLANAFVQRPEFLAKYPASQSGAEFINAILTRIRNDIGTDLSSQSQGLMILFSQGGRGAVLYRLADDNAQTNPINNRSFLDAEYNRSFVYTQYAGYLRRDSDIGGFLFWLARVNEFPVRDATIQHVMVCAFITSDEYQQRFSSVVTHHNSECGSGP